ncbi:hypothetical protein XENORESO_014158 [Xenotaenia resolanae]|uniref:Uncharacterized protein n=1 Tax=Xenotaenia resolanae TaxID=208358 RepID=A0ABV0VQY6_9TELE
MLAMNRSMAEPAELHKQDVNFRLSWCRLIHDAEHPHSPPGRENKNGPVCFHHLQTSEHPVDSLRRPCWPEQELRSWKPKPFNYRLDGTEGHFNLPGRSISVPTGRCLGVLQVLDEHFLQHG